MAETEGPKPEIEMHVPDLSGKKDLVSKFARAIQRVLGIKPETEANPLPAQSSKLDINK
jgi:hypothetical protein